MSTKIDLSAYICIIFCTENNIHMEVYFWPFIYEPRMKFIPRHGIRDVFSHVRLIFVYRSCNILIKCSYI